MSVQLFGDVYLIQVG